MAVFVLNRIGIEPVNNVWRFLIAGNPSSAGLTAGVGSIAEQIDASGDVWEKTGAGDTAWTLRLDAGAVAQELTADQIDALVGTSGTPNAANKYVTNSDARLGGGTGLTGITSAQNDGSLTGDGVTDDRANLNTLVNTTLSSGGTVYFEPGTYLIGSDITLPRNVWLWFARGAILKPAAGVTITCLSQIQDCGYQIFDTTTTGIIRFAVATLDNTNSNAAPSTMPWIRPEWWGAVADKSTDNATALQRCIDAACGYPADAATYARYADAKILLSSGWYLTNSELTAHSVHGLTIEGAGMDNTRLYGGNVGDSGTADASGNTTTTLTQTGQNWTVNQWADYYCWMDLGGASAKLARIASNTVDTLTFEAAQSSAPDGLHFMIAQRSVLRLNGCQEAVVKDLTITFANSTGWSYGLMYHRENPESAIGSSSSNFYNVKVDGTGNKFIYAGFRIGSDGLSAAATNQEDITSFFGCQVYSGWTSGARNSQHGFYFGTGQFSNNLIHSLYGTKVVRTRYGVLVNCASAYVHGGCIQSNDVDYRMENGAQHCLKVWGVRSEGSRMLFETSSSQSLPFNMTFDGCTCQQTALANDATALKPIVGRTTVNGSLILRDIRFNALPEITGTATSATATTLTDSGASFATTNSGYAGWRVYITSGTGYGQDRVITSNTATQITVPTWTTTPDATSNYVIMPIPQLSVSSGCNLEIEDVQVTNASLKEFIPSLSSFSRASVKRYRRLHWDNGVGNLNEYYDVDIGANSFNRPWRAMGVHGADPDVWMARSRTGTYGISQLESSNFTVTTIGTTATPFADKAGSHTAGATSHTYYLVAKDGSGNKALCSLGVGVDNCLATLDLDNYVRVYLNTSAADWKPAAKYDLLVERGVDRDGLAPNTPVLLAADLTPADLQTFRDIGQPTLGSYTVPTSDATGTCDLQGKTLSRVYPVTKTAAYTVTTSDDLLHGNASSAAFTFTLPAIDSAPNYQFTFRKVDNTANAVTIDGNGAETINGAASYTLSAEHEMVTVYNTGTGTTNWYAA